MKKSALINADVSHLIACLGHGQEITVCDAGLPIAKESHRIDLALMPGVPDFISTLSAILSEMQLEGVIIAEEFGAQSPELHGELMSLIANEEIKLDKPVQVTYVSHEAFKLRSNKSEAVVRTGEFTPYANIILQAGVVF
ncbi:Hypothetical ribose ABC transporter protein [Marinomonas sp. MED121]|uniref:D-ribose pyranase n=1 Tax=Marinomonas sp. MED121 TaxID=314277 RepID=UPI0000691179|nr:D-ribose pyranase [Marinomonas sp. MED121]EAQ67213.1 Hypothetical ribose ABC transporter protein [Marinomonas sp. MED121]